MKISDEGSRQLAFSRLRDAHHHYVGCAVAVAIAEERMACAKIAGAQAHCHESPEAKAQGKMCGCAWCASAEKIAAAIRARGAK